MSSPLRVWGIGTPRTLRPHWVLAEFGLDYECRPVLTRTPAMETPAFRAVSPRHKTPILEHGELVIGESAAICLYLAETFAVCGAESDGASAPSEMALPGPGTPERARHSELCFFVMTEMDALLYVLRRHEGLAGIYGEAEAACTTARSYFLRSAEEIVRRLADGRPHLLGDAFSVADVLLASTLQWAAFVEIELPAVLDRYRERLFRRPACTRAVEINFPRSALAALGAG